MNYTRRDFGRIALASAPVAAALSLPRFAIAAPNSKFDGVQVGVITYSFRQGVPKTDLPSVIGKIGINSVELMSGDAEVIAGIPVQQGGGGFGGFGGPGGAGGRGGSGGRGGGGRAEVALAPNGCAVNTPLGQISQREAGGASGGAARGGFGGGRGPLTPEQQAAQAEFQQKVKDWKASTNDATWKGVVAKFKEQGANVDVLCYNMGVNVTDDEINYAFNMARAMGVKAISCSSTVAVAKRVAPFADKYKIMWAGHGHADIHDPEQFAKPETFDYITSLSKYIGINLDIGHFTGAGYDPVSFITSHHDRITNIHMKDTTKPDKCEYHVTLPWGTGQTPIMEVLLLMKKNRYTFPANIELEYAIPAGSDSVAEVANCLAFAKKCFA